MHISIEAVDEKTCMYDLGTKQAHGIHVCFPHLNGKLKGCICIFLSHQKLTRSLRPIGQGAIVGDVLHICVHTVPSGKKEKSKTEEKELQRLIGPDNFEKLSTKVN